MFGMEKNGSKTPSKFEYELERKLKKSPSEVNRIGKEIDKKLLHFKSALREGTDKESFMCLSLLMHGYLAYKKVIERFSK